MKLGIMQPYFFPYTQQFRHIAQCDRWILFDTVKFSRKSWMNRNRIADRNSGWSYISVPVAKGESTKSIANAHLAETDWRTELQNKLRVYYGSAKYYDQTIALVECCTGATCTTLGELNARIIINVSQALGIGTEIELLSEMNFELPEKAGPGEWALHISKAVGATVYSNAPGGRHLFDVEHYANHNIALEFYEPIDLSYDTPGFSFTPDLSIVDALMWNGIDGIGNFIRS